MTPKTLHHNRLIAVAAAFLIFSANMLVVVGAHAHSVYATFTQVEWNHQDGSIELIINLHSHELETKLSLMHGRQLSYLNEEDFDELNKAAGDYLLANIALTLDDTLINLNYLGSESDGQNVTLYMEADWPTAPQKIRIMNAMFLNDLPGQTNSILAVVKDKREGGDIVRDSGPLNFIF